MAAGMELRVDYDRGNAARPYMAQLEEEGVTLESMRSTAYQEARWVRSEAAEDGREEEAAEEVEGEEEEGAVAGEWTVAERAEVYRRVREARTRQVATWVAECRRLPPRKRGVWATAEGAHNLGRVEWYLQQAGDAHGMEVEEGPGLDGWWARMAAGIATANACYVEVSAAVARVHAADVAQRLARSAAAAEGEGAEGSVDGGGEQPQAEEGAAGGEEASEDDYEGRVRMGCWNARDMHVEDADAPRRAHAGTSSLLRLCLHCRN